MSDQILFEETFRISSVNKNKYDRCARIEASRDDTYFKLDINSDLYPCHEDETVQMVIASTLALDGGKEEEGGEEKGRQAWKEYREGEASLADTFDYVCYGKVYRFEEGEGDKIHVYVSFGGLLLFLEGPHKKLSTLRVDYVYLLLKK